jgi:hypothetical protein
MSSVAQPSPKKLMKVALKAFGHGQRPKQRSGGQERTTLTSAPPALS